MTVMLFNTVIPLSTLGIKTLSSQSVLFRWECSEGGARGRGRRLRDKFQVGCSGPLKAPVAVWGDFCV